MKKSVNKLLSSVQNELLIKDPFVILKTTGQEEDKKRGNSTKTRFSNCCMKPGKQGVVGWCDGAG